MLRFALLILCVALAGCRTVPDLPAAREAAVAYTEQGGYEADVADTVAKARTYVAREATRSHPRMAMVLDVDDTAISTYALQKRMGFGFCGSALKTWRKEANAPAIEPVKELFHFARRCGVAVFFVTGRRDRDRAATEANLASAGYQGYAGLYTKPDNYHERSVAPYKTACRRDIEAKGYRILVNLGDQKSDLADGHADLALKLPNPFYVVE